MKRCVAVVPMKLNNRRLPGKNTKRFTNGEPLCHYVLNTLKDIELIDEIYVYCSDSSIKSYLPSGIKYLERSKSLDQDTTKINEVLSNFASVVKSDIYLMTHATAPFITKESIIKGLESVLSGEYDSSFAATRCQDFMWKDNLPMNYSLNSIPRTQDLDPIYIETSGFYCYTYDIITNFNRRIGNKPKIVEVTGIEAIDIDEQEDFELADAVYNFILKPVGGGGAKDLDLINLLDLGVLA
ncbi:acylneuraminate cytidylyltransferase family protein [Methanomethylophilus alvi]|uniref:acylneuraminate cytidylyltransferase family protein n=1 Tax=Methanomethylophilus alvi TaxID=1291540 RepID=UPI0037DC8ED7